MTYKDLFIGETKLVTEPKEVQGESVIVDGERYYKISNVDGMRPFFMSIVSHSDHWMFISSNGGLTAGRRNSEQALFPYYTDDKITASADTTGSRTIIHVHGEDRQGSGSHFPMHVWGVIRYSEISTRVIRVTRSYFRKSILIWV